MIESAFIGVSCFPALAESANVTVLFTTHTCLGEVVLIADEVLKEDGNPGVVIRL